MTKSLVSFCISCVILYSHSHIQVEPEDH